MTKYREAKERLDNILEMLEHTDFGYWMEHDPVPYNAPEYDDCDGDNSLYDFFSHGNYPVDIDWSSGATRVVFWDKNHKDYVFKVAIYFEDEHYNETEERLYNEAEFKDVEEAFAWCSCIYSPNEKFSRAIYAMEYIECDEELLNDETYSYGLEQFCIDRGFDSSDEDARDEYSDYYCSYCDENEELMDYACESWGYKLAHRVRQFISDFEISDLHSGNMGFRNSQVVITDYASYC